MIQHYSSRRLESKDVESVNSSSNSLESANKVSPDEPPDEPLFAGGRRSKLEGSLALRLDEWPTVDLLSIPIEKRELFEERYRAFRLYQSGAALAYIHEETGISPQRFYQLLDRCLEAHPDGRIYGFRALIPSTRIHGYRRQKPVELSLGDHQGGGAGAFQKLLADYPVLLELIYSKLFPKKSRLLIAERRISIRKLHAAFLVKCRELGLAERFAYPFNTDLLGYRSLCRFVEQLQKEHPEKAALYRMVPGADRKLRTGDGTDRPALALMDRVECDAHHLDAVFCVLVPTSFGNFVPRILKRLWLIALIEVRSRVVLGYHLSLRKECNEEDLLTAIKHSLVRWQPRQLTVPEQRYPDKAGFLASLNPAYTGACWNEFSVDGAKINRSLRVEHVLKEVVKSETFYNRRRSPDDRPYIERFFRTLEAGHFHQMPNTVGGSPVERNGSNPELAAVKYFIQLDHLYDLLDIAISGYNATPHSSLGGRTPLEYFDYCLRTSGQELRIADPVAVSRIHALRKKVRVRGSMAEGRRPFIEFMGARYTNDYLKRAFDLVGQEITIEVDTQDPRVITAYGPSGGELGKMYAGVPWNVLPHTLEIRRAYYRAVRAGKINASTNNAVVALLLHLEEQARVGKEVPNLYLELRNIIVSHEEIVRKEYDSRNIDAPVGSGDFIPAEPRDLRNASLQGDLEGEKASSSECPLPVRPRKARVGV